MRMCDSERAQTRAPPQCSRFSLSPSVCMFVIRVGWAAGVGHLCVCRLRTRRLPTWITYPSEMVLNSLTCSATTSTIFTDHHWRLAQALVAHVIHAFPFNGPDIVDRARLQQVFASALERGFMSFQLGVKLLYIPAGTRVEFFTIASSHRIVMGLLILLC